MDYIQFPYLTQMTIQIIFALNKMMVLTNIYKTKTQWCKHDPEFPRLKQNLTKMTKYKDYTLITILSK